MTPQMLRMAASRRWMPRRLGSALGFWLDVPDSSTRYQDSAFTTPAVADADPVGGWKDKSGNGRHATQATGSKRPLLKLAIQNNLPCILDDNVDDELDFTSLALTGFTIFLAGKMVGANAAANYWLGGNAQGSALSLTSVAGGYGVFDGTNLRDSTTNSTAFNVYTFQPAKLWLNGAEPSYASAQTLTGLTVSRLFSRTDVSNLRGNCYIGEIFIATQTLADGVRRQAESYLRRRWGTP